MNEYTGTLREQALTRVNLERDRQERMKAEGRFKYTCADQAMTDHEFVAVLGEEFGEVCRQALTQPDDPLAHDTSGSLEGLLKETIHVAAVAVAKAEALLEEAKENGIEVRQPGAAPLGGPGGQ